MRAAARTVPVLAMLFIPIALQLPALFPWARPEALSDELWRHREPYLNAPFFLGRAVFYLVAWVVLALAVTRSRGVGRLMSSLVGAVIGPNKHGARIVPRGFDAHRGRDVDVLHRRAISG